MFIKKFDFLNSPPQLYFLEKKTNKTLFGGILFIIYFLLMLTISIFYILDYCLNDKYDVEYTLYKYFSNEEDLISKEEYNNFNFTINLKRLTQEFDEEELNKHFVLMDSDFNQLERNQTFSLNTDEMIFYIVYVCFGDCTPVETNDDLSYSIQINYPGYKIDHQNETTPLEMNNNNITFTEVLFFNYDKMSMFEIDFEILKYKEEKGLLGLFEKWMNKKNEYNWISIGSVAKTEAQTFLDIDEGEEGYKAIIKVLSVIKLNNNKHQIEEYVRKRRSPLDVLANIGSLFSTLFKVFSVLFKFYSEKNNNYAIIKELLSSPRIFTNSNPNINILKSRTIKFENNLIRNKNYLNFEKNLLTLVNLYHLNQKKIILLIKN